MDPRFSQPDEDGKRKVTVWSDGGTALLFAESLHINTDGTRRSYKVEDFWGQRDAVNNLCNAMSDKCADMKEPALRARRILTEKAKAGGWKQADLTATKLSPKIIPLGSDGKPCPEQDGFLVSATALENLAVKNVCDPQRYVDAMHTPAIVLPGRIEENTPTGFERGNVRVGDLVVVATPDLTKIAYAVVGDIGPKKELGEGTIELARSLLGKDHDPVNYREVRGKDPYEGQGWDVRRVVTLLFSGTRNMATPYMTKQRIDQDGAAKFASWGGLERLKACISTYR